MYQVGDFIVKAANGICEVKDIVNPDFVDDDKKLYYELQPLSDSKTVLYVSTDRDDGSMRAVITEEEAQNLIKMIPTIDEPWINNERERERNYKEAIKSNEPEKLIGIIKLIYQRKRARQEQGKKTTMVDKQYFDKAENLLYSELELVLKKSRDEIYDQIKNSVRILPKRSYKWNIGRNIISKRESPVTSRF